jgi:hypothetical protein
VALVEYSRALVSPRLQNLNVATLLVLADQYLVEKIARSESADEDDGLDIEISVRLHENQVLCRRDGPTFGSLPSFCFTLLT